MPGSVMQAQGTRAHATQARRTQAQRTLGPATQARIPMSVPRVDSRAVRFTFTTTSTLAIAKFSI